MNQVEAEVLYRSIADQVVEIYEEGVREHPGIELMVLHVPSHPEFPLPLPLSDFKDTLRGRAPDILKIVEDEGCEAGAFWFAIVEGDDAYAQVYIRVVHPDKHRAGRVTN